MIGIEWLAKGQAVTEATVKSTNAIDTKKAKQGAAPAFICCRVAGAFANLDDINVWLEDSADGVTFAAVGVQSGVKVSVAAGDYLLAHQLPEKTRQWVQVGMDVNGTSVTGTLDLFLSDRVDSFVAK